jgi:hypothetical protein
MNQQQQQQQQNYQWRVTWHVQGQDDETEYVSRFSDAWAMAQPWPEERGEGGGWTYTRRADGLASFMDAPAGPFTVIVARTRDGRQWNSVSRE